MGDGDGTWQTGQPAASSAASQAGAVVHGGERAAVQSGSTLQPLGASADVDKCVHQGLLASSQAHETCPSGEKRGFEEKRGSNKKVSVPVRDSTAREREGPAHMARYIKGARHSDDFYVANERERARPTRRRVRGDWRVCCGRAIM